MDKIVLCTFMMLKCFSSVPQAPYPLRKCRVEEQLTEINNRSFKSKKLLGLAPGKRLYSDGI